MAVLPPVGPMDHMVNVTPAGWPVTTGMLTVAVAGDHSPPHGGWYHPGGPTDINRLPIGAEHDPGDGGVTGQHADLFGGEDLTGHRLMHPTTPTLQSVKVGPVRSPV